MKKTISIILMALLVSVSFCQKLTLGEYTFRVDTLNTSERIISNAVLEAELQENIVIIRAKAPGYQLGQSEVLLQDDKKDYIVRLHLKDPFVKFVIKSLDGKEINTHIDTDQTPVPGTDTFEFLVTINQDHFTQISLWDIDMKFNKSAKHDAHIAVRADPYYSQVYVVLKRHNMNHDNNLVELIIPKDSEIVKSRKQTLHRLKYQQVHDNELSTQLSESQKSRLINLERLLK